VDVVEGSVERGWEGVRDAFSDALEGDDGAGGAVCVYVDGVPVVDLWGGAARPGGTPWQRDTAACVFSASKGVAAICAHMLVERGVLDLDAPVSSYWPEFAQAGKQDLEVRWILTHQAGLLLLDDDLSLDDVIARAPVVRALERQQPQWQPGTAVGYHAVTYGFLLGELVRRVTGRSLGHFLAEEVAGPLRLNAWLGLPEDQQLDLATIERRQDGTGMLEALIAADPHGPVAQFVRVLTLGGAFPMQLVLDGVGDFNDRRVLATELAAAGLVTDARSLARVYAATVSDVDGIRLLTPAAAAECVPLRTTDTPIFGTPPDAPRTLDFGLGFLARPYLSSASFGHTGASGSVGFADVDSRVGFGYVPRLMREEGTDGRGVGIIEAVRQALA
jgi:CubicO group peptidase (beta-lactamase class C family)